MNKHDLVSAVADRNNVSKKVATEFIDSLFNADGGILANAFSRDETVSIHGFGKMSGKVRPGRTGRNPQTGEALDIPAKRVVKWQPSSSLLNAIN